MPQSQFIITTEQASGAAPGSFTGLDLARISPQRGAKFSPNLHAFLTGERQKGLAPRARVFLDQRSVQWLGYFDDNGLFVGTRLSNVLCSGRKADATCPINLGPLHEDEGFWTRYLADGRCAIDPDHSTAFMGERWATRDTTRSCLWCNKVTQQLHQTLRTTTKVESNWVNHPAESQVS